MSDEPKPAAPPPADQRALAYLVAGAVSLALLVLIQVRQGQWVAANLLLVVIGGWGLLARFRVAPVLVLLLVALGEVLRRYFSLDFRWEMERQQETTLRPVDVLRSVAVLGYVVAHYRLQGLHRHIFPPDYRLAAQHALRGPGLHWGRAHVERRRGAQTMPPLEVPLFILSLPVFALLGQLAWNTLAHPRDVLEWDPWIGRLAVILVTLVLAVTLTAALLRTWRRRQMVPDEARLLLQDALWNETRGEQRWLTRWLARCGIQQKEQS
jgi:hypothetical protein